MKRMVSENLIAILKEMDSKGISIGDLADTLSHLSVDEDNNLVIEDGKLENDLDCNSNQLNGVSQINFIDETIMDTAPITYTAGTGITINEDNEISANAGEIWESVLELTIGGDVACVRLFTKEELTSSNAKTILGDELNLDKYLDCYMKNMNNYNFVVSCHRYTGTFYYDTLSYDGTNFHIVSHNMTWTSLSVAVQYSHKLN